MRPPDPMLSRPGPLPQYGRWSYEVKWDGFRALVSTVAGLRVRSRRGWNMTALLPELEALPAGLVLATGRRRCERRGWSTRSPYAMRHSYAALAISVGLPTYEIAATMGTSLEQLSKTYAHLLADSADRARAALDASIAASSKDVWGLTADS